jgi:hypothetical protein
MRQGFRQIRTEAADVEDDSEDGVGQKNQTTSNTNHRLNISRER